MRKPAPPSVLGLPRSPHPENSLLKHPFYKAVDPGYPLPRVLKLYAQQYYRHVEAFPLHLALLASRSCNGELRDLINDNLAEELDPANPAPRAVAPVRRRGRRGGLHAEGSQSRCRESPRC